MENYDLFIFLLVAWFYLAVASYTLREIPHIWSKATEYKLKLKWMAESKWWTDASPRSDSWFKNLTGLNTFDDAYHFFGNLPRIVLSILLAIMVNWLVGLITFFFWWIGREITLHIILEKK